MESRALCGAALTPPPEPPRGPLSAPEVLDLCVRRPSPPPLPPVSTHTMGYPMAQHRLMPQGYTQCGEPHLQPMLVPRPMRPLPLRPAASVAASAAPCGASLPLQRPFMHLTQHQHGGPQTQQLCSLPLGAPPVSPPEAPPVAVAATTSPSTIPQNIRYDDSISLPLATQVLSAAAGRAVGSSGSSKPTRPFKAYPKDPLSLTAGLQSADALLAASSEAYAEFRRRVLEHTSGGSGPKRAPGSLKRPASPQQQPSSSDAAGEPSLPSAPKETHTDGSPSSPPPNAIMCLTSAPGGGHGKERDAAYWERRRRNNEAAKRSRDARRAKEDEIAIRAAFLEQENLRLRCELAAARAGSAAAARLVYSSTDNSSVQSTTQQHPHHLAVTPGIDHAAAAAAASINHRSVIWSNPNTSSPLAQH